MILPVWKCELNKEGTPMDHSYNTSAKKKATGSLPGTFKPVLSWFCCFLTAAFKGTF